MENPVSVMAVLKILADFGVVGLVIILWWLNDRQKSQLMANYREDMQTILKKYGDDMIEVRGMYRSNVKLVEAYERIAKDLQDVVILNTTAMTRLVDRIKSRKDCD